MNSLCFIPAKGRSLRLKKKNFLKIGGKELFVRAIEAAKNSKCFKKIIVSSEDKTILKIAKDYGALPVLREKKLSKKDVRVKDVLKKFLKKDNTIYDNITMLMPTSPLRNSRHIKEAHNKFCSSNCKTLVSIKEFNFNPGMALKIYRKKLIPFYGKKFKWKRENFFPKAYHFNGAIFIAEYKYFIKNFTFIDDQTIPYVMDEVSSIDVDTLEDLQLAEFYYNKTK